MIAVGGVRTRLEFQVPAAVAAALDDVYDPYRLVTSILHEARMAGEGRVPDITRFTDACQALVDFADQHGVTVDTVDFRLCLLDPARPACDLLEDLFMGVGICYLVFQSYLPAGDEPAEDRRDVVDVCYRRAAETVGVFFDAVRRHASALPPAC